MSNGVSQHRDAAHAGDPVLEIPDHSAGELLIDRLRKNLTSVKIRDAGNYNDQTRNLVLQYLELMKLDEQDAIIGQMDEIGKLEKKLENNRSPFRKLFLVRDFKRVSKETYLIVKKLSNRIIDDQIKGRHRAATDPQGWPTFPHGPAPRPNGGSFTAPVFPVATAVDPSVNSFGNAFTNPQVASALAAAACSNLGRVELTKFESRTTGG
ncbi:hypothetical protein BC826DRAFT_316638 [Russula brevipes]|nr:hypothetical protein BC826DRAFT_316638 [Russula brevipes]